MIKETIYSNIETTNSKQVALLKKHFPQFFDKKGNLIQEKIIEVVQGDEVELSNESYSLNWLGKSYARLLTNLPPKTLINEDDNHNQLEENRHSKNLLIKGDNLEVLKHMVNAYSEKVKVIYIDPPYNTGKDGFTYQDDRKFTKEQLSELAGIELDEAKRILEFTDKGSSSHSAWLTFIYPRLYVAREFLQEDGVIFVSIDDNELSQLKVICDEIFGEQNHLGNVIWKNVTDNNPTNIAVEHEYIVAFAKDKTKLDSKWKSNVSEIKDSLVELGNELASKYSDPKELQSVYTAWFKENKFQLGPLDRYKFIDEGGIYTGSQSVHNPGKDGYRYDVIHPKTLKPCKLPLMGYRFKESTMQALIDSDKIIYGKDHNKIIELKLYAEEFEEKFSSILDLDGRLGANELRDIFPEMKKVFTNPKPTQLIEKLISYVCNGDGVILDFFAGSGTTAHAVFNLNNNEKTSYQFITVQLDEPTKKDSEPYKNGYDTVFDVTKERLIRAGRACGNSGFKVFEVVEDFRAQDDAELTLSNFSFFDDAVLTKEQYDTTLTTWCLYDGSLLTTPIQDVDLNGYRAHLCDGRLYLIAPDFSSNSLKELLKKLDLNKEFAPNKVIIYSRNFESAKQMELNEALNSYANKKSLELELVVRN
ncbi:site-specific DNA-methyltransferase [Oceanisphaera arctica]|nr:site-specific DNA-methyltransferase [Oceanisphaera arctica]GHA05331.1 type III restriction endonuclease EcoP15I subunit M [Oceanisphaera arctica]